MKLLVDVLAGKAPRGLSVHMCLGMFVGLIALESLLWRLSGWCGTRATVQAGVNIRVDLFNHLAGHSMKYFDENLSGALGHRITATAGAFGALTNRLMWDVTPPCINFVGAVIIFAALDAPMTVALTGAIVASTLLLVLFGLRGRPHHRAYARQASVAVGELMDVVANIWALKSFSAGARERARLSDQFVFEAQAHQRSSFFNEKVRALNDLCMVLSAGGTLLWSMHLWAQGRISPGDVILITALTLRLLYGSRELALSLIDMGQHYTYLEETLALIGGPHQISDPPVAGPVSMRGGTIVFDKVTFGYTPEQPVLRDLCLNIPAGQRVGFVGASGAGKSTITHLVQRLYEAQSGQILVDGVSVRSIRQDCLRDKIAAVPQQVSLFHRSIRDNIWFARPDATEHEVHAAAAAAFCDEFIGDLVHGYDTIVGDRGAKLSGGQRQRIGIARAFLKDAPILVLDEATSALDPESEAAIQLALKRLMRGRTVLAVAHRLSTLADLDRIIVLAGGRVAEDGSMADLRSQGGIFDHLWQLQMQDAAQPFKQSKRNAPDGRLHAPGF